MNSSSKHSDTDINQQPQPVMLLGKKKKREETKAHNDSSMTKTKKELTIIKKKKVKFNPTYVVPPKNKFKSSMMLVNVIDKIIGKHDPIGLLRAHRKLIINKINVNEAILLKQLTNKGSDIYYTSYSPMVLSKYLSVAPTASSSTKQGKSLINHSEEIALLSKRLAKQCENEIFTLYENTFITTDIVTNIDILRYKCENNYFPTKALFYDDIIAMFDYIRRNIEFVMLKEYIGNETVSELYVKYLSEIFEVFIRIVEKCDVAALFNEDIKEMIELNKLPRSSLQISSIPVRKNYEVIDNYCHIKPEITIPKTQTSIEGKCNGECCNDYDKLGPLNLETSRWNSNCSDRSKNIECNSSLCGCDSLTCKNQSLYKQSYKKLNEDVEERYTWGIDLFTYRNLLYLFPENYNNDIPLKDFIEKCLMIALSKLGVNGNRIDKGCDYIITHFNSYSPIEMNLAQHLLEIYKISSYAYDQIGTAYSKGIGIFCIKADGIKQNELIAPYLGEIYPPWLWFEKQDIIKRKKLDVSLPDFYNILLERMKYDSDGYDILMIDPNSKGNFASRMSHSCEPNCNTVLMVSDHKYTIGMFATKNIANDEELTFDYNSVTEKEKEFQDAICLCSSFNCRGHYLILSSSMVFTEIVTKFHSFLHRNAILVKACAQGMKELNEKEMNILSKFSIGNSVLSGAPIWLKRWAALVLDFVDVEKELLPIILYKAEKQEQEDNEMKKIREKQSLLNLKKGREREKEKGSKGKKGGVVKEKGNSGRGKERMKGSKQVFNYNFIDDFVWDSKKYKSSSRATKIVIDTTDLLFKDFKKDKKVITNEENDDEEGQNDNNEDNEDNVGEGEDQEEEAENNDNDNDIKIDEVMNDIKEDNENICEINNPNETNLIIDQSTQKQPFNSLLISKDNDDLSKKEQQTDNPPHITPNTQQLNLNPLISTETLKSIFSELNLDINDTFPSNETITNSQEDNAILSLESNDFSFLSELNLQLEPGYDKDLFTSIKYQVSNITEQRIQNLVITLDKIKHVLNRLNSTECPLKILSEEEIYNYYWKNNSSSIRGILKEKFLSIQVNLLASNNPNEEVKEIINKIIQKLSDTLIHFVSKNVSYSKMNIKIRKIFIEISLLIKKLDVLDKHTTGVYYEGLSDILFLYANTRIHFTPNSALDRAQLLSETIQIRKRDVDPSCLPEKFKDAELDAIIEESHKEYENHYIWGQLAGWYKQTVDKPNASLSAERRGTLSYPELDSFFNKNLSEKDLAYPCGGKKVFYEKIEENISRMWPVGNNWSYKNKNKIYGTVQFDAVYTHNFYLNKVKDYMKKVINIITADIK